MTRRRSPAPSRRAGRAAVGVALVVSWCAACRSAEAPPPTSPTPTEPTAPAACEAPAEPDAVVARIHGTPVTASELDRGFTLPLYDLERARWELRAGRLRDLLVARVLGPLAAADGVAVDEWIRRRAGDADPATAVDAALRAAGVDVVLAEPDPPVIEVGTDDDPVRGPADAPVTVIEFVDYQSPFCARMQPVLRRLLARYPTQVRLVVRDVPLAVHRDAARAAEAADCAGEQGAYWAYHDVLLQEQDDLGRPALERYATRVGLEAARFAACLDDGRMRAEVEADAADARRLGIAVAPTTFVDGRYLKGPQPYEVLVRWVEQELARLGIAASAAAPAATTTLPGTSPPSETTVEPAAAASAITLPASVVDRALARLPRLRRDLDRPAMEPGPGYEGHRLVRVRRAQPGVLYDTMGLRAGDVLIRLDGALVMDDAAPLFDALRAHRSFTLQVLRHGLPVSFAYTVE